MKGELDLGFAIIVAVAALSFFLGSIEEVRLWLWALVT